VEAYPVYAPALVSFVDVAAGALVGAAIGRSFGWIPLGAREPYYPPCRASPAYLRQVNVGNVTNVTTITTVNNTTINNYANRGAATVVPASVVQASQPVAPQARAIPAQQLAALRPVQAAPVQPTFATVGVTPAVARAMNLRPVAGAPPPRPVAPGSVVQARPAGAVALHAPGAAPVAPTVQTPGAAPPAASVEPGRPGLAAGTGALLGGAAGLGGAALLNRSAQPRPAGLPPLSAPRTAPLGVPAAVSGPPHHAARRRAAKCGGAGRRSSRPACRQRPTTRERHATCARAAGAGERSARAAPNGTGGPGNGAPRPDCPPGTRGPGRSATVLRAASSGARAGAPRCATAPRRCAATTPGGAATARHARSGTASRASPCRAEKARSGASMMKNRGSRAIRRPAVPGRRSRFRRAGMAWRRTGPAPSFVPSQLPACRS